MALICPSWHSGCCTMWCHFTVSYLLQNIRTTWWFPSVLILDEKLHFQLYVLSSKRWIIYLENDPRFQLEIHPLEILLFKNTSLNLMGAVVQVPHPSACLSPRTVVGWCFLWNTWAVVQPLSSTGRGKHVMDRICQAERFTQRAEQKHMPSEL